MVLDWTQACLPQHTSQQEEEIILSINGTTWRIKTMIQNEGCAILKTLRLTSYPCPKSEIFFFSSEGITQVTAGSVNKAELFPEAIVHHWKSFGLKRSVLCSEAWNSHRIRIVDKRKGVQRREGDLCPLQECSLATVKHRQCYTFQRKQRQNSGLISSVMSREVPSHAHSSLNTCRPSSLATHRKPAIAH